ncbi:pilus assembly PilX N-terminal domain-containing protein [Candidatus Berkelbacteria bacterium]|nr:pilus assembly PilX N-terminal domain-containing protein [Candidatus Berkelbacteria bacterium]
MKKGSALIISLLAITAITAAIFGAASLTVLEMRQSRRAEDSQIAFYAAEAGIERGLMAYRGDKNNRSFGSFSSWADLSNSAKYQWKSNFLGDKFNKTTEIKVDEAMEVNLEGQSLTSVNIGWSWQGTPDITAKIEVIKVFVGGVSDLKFIGGPSQSSESNFDVVNVQKLRLRPLKTGLSGLNIVPTSSNSSQKIDTGATTIESIGTAGSVQRRLVATVDRQSGALISVFDYALVTTSSAPTGNISP